MEHSFTKVIKSVLETNFKTNADVIFDNSLLLQYLNFKTRSADRGSKSRSSFANIYAIYVIVEDYVSHGFQHNNNYKDYSGAVYSHLLARQRELPFGEKLQNHALNNRVNSEFQKFFPNSYITPIIRNLETNKYWINENFLKIKINNTIYNIAETVLTIIGSYIEKKQETFKRFISLCESIKKIQSNCSEE